MCALPLRRLLAGSGGGGIAAASAHLRRARPYCTRNRSPVWMGNFISGYLSRVDLCTLISNYLAKAVLAAMIEAYAQHGRSLQASRCCSFR